MIPKLLSKHHKGLPCMLGDIVGRIVGESNIGSWGDINGERLFSVPLMATPHGTIITVGRFYLNEITEDGMERLLAYENELMSSGSEMYAGLIHFSNTSSQWV